MKQIEMYYFGLVLVVEQFETNFVDVTFEYASILVMDFFWNIIWP